ncbi:MAG TPA: triose-phosphate isomerase [Spirochaetia bacterium]|nr:triose-phosphate isomerase [Spirochaetia bacterium]
MRSNLVAGNWKMNLGIGESVTLARTLRDNLGNLPGVLVCPPFTALAAVGAELRGTGIALGAQNMYWEEQGAFTGEVAPGMLVDVGCSYVILGHSERRQSFGETDAGVKQKVVAARKHGLTPIVCVGELLSHREAGRTEEVVRGQVAGGLFELEAESVAGLVVAYEPVWAIGTGRTATETDAQQVCSFIRGLLESRYGPAVAGRVPVLYGGSVKAANASGIMGQSDIDGVLVGGASLSATEFTAIAKAAL